MIRITIDTDVLIAGVDGSDESKRSAYATLKQLHERRVIEMATTTRLETEKANDRDPARRARHMEEAKQFQPAPAAWTVGVSPVGGGDRIIEDSDVATIAKINNIVRGERGLASRKKQHDFFDGQHLFAHLRCGRDYFLTYDGGILKRRRRLNELGIRAEDPRDFLRSHVAGAGRANVRARGDCPGTGRS